MYLNICRWAVKAVSLTLLAVFGATPAFAADVNTVAGNGAAGFSGDGGPAIAASLFLPAGLAVAADGTVYFADTDNYRVRRISPDGTIDTVAGNGVDGGIDWFDDDGDGGQATDASISLTVSVALSPADDILYIADDMNNRVRQVDLGTGVITNFAGAGWAGFDFAGDGGPATVASFRLPEAVAVDASGNVYIGDTFNCAVRRVDIATHIITTVAGDPNDCTPSGDGGDARSARLSLPLRLALDPAGNLYVLDSGSPSTVRRVDAATNIITTVAGGGSTVPGFGAATTMNLGSVRDIAVDAANNLYIASYHQVFKVDHGTGNLSVFAGTGASGFSGDGGPAENATFRAIGGVASRGDQILIVDTENNRVRAVVPPPLPDDLIIDLATSQAVLDSLNAMAGSLLMINVDGRDYLVVPNLASVGLDVTLTDNDQLLVIDLSALQSVGGNITISGNLALQSVDLGALATVDGSLSISGNPALNAILVSGVTGIGGDLTLIGTAATVIDLSSLTSVGGSIDLSGNDALTTIDASSLTTVGGSIDLSGDTSLTTIDASSLTTVGGSIDLSGDTSLTTVDASSLTTVGGSIDLSGDTSLTTIDASSLTTVGGSIDLSGDTSLTTIDASSLTTVGGSIDLSGDTSLTTVDASSLTTVGGSIDLSGDTSLTTIDMSSLTTVGGSIDLSGDTSLTTIDMSSLVTASGSVDVSGNSALTTIDMSSLVTASGSVDVSDNTALTTIDMSSLVTVSGSVDVSGNSAAATIDMSGLTTSGGSITIVDNGAASVDLSGGTDVDGDLIVETTGSGTFDTGDGIVTGEITLDTTGYTEISGTTPGGALDLTATNLEAMMHLQVQAATFDAPVSFTVNRVDPVGLVPEGGVDAGGAPATIDPIAAYQFNFAVPTLNRDATLSFDIDLAQIDAATRTGILNALAAGTATLVTRGDAVGSVFQAFPLCTSGQTPTANGCVRIEIFDALGQPTSGTPAIVRFSNVVGHFSTWAVATVTEAAQANRTVICSTLGNRRLFDADFFEFNGVKGEQVTVALAANPAGTFTPGKAALILVGIGVLAVDMSALPNTITATLPQTGKYLVPVVELLLRAGKFQGDYCVSIESTQNAWQSFHQK